MILKMFHSKEIITRILVPIIYNFINYRRVNKCLKFLCPVKTININTPDFQHFYG